MESKKVEITKPWTAPIEIIISSDKDKEFFRIVGPEFFIGRSLKEDENHNWESFGLKLTNYVQYDNIFCFPGYTGLCAKEIKMNGVSPIQKQILENRLDVEGFKGMIKFVYGIVENPFKKETVDNLRVELKRDTHDFNTPGHLQDYRLRHSLFPKKRLVVDSVSAHPEVDFEALSRKGRGMMTPGTIDETGRTGIYSPDNRED